MSNIRNIHNIFVTLHKKYKTTEVVNVLHLRTSLLETPLFMRSSLYFSNNNNVDNHREYN